MNRWPTILALLALVLLSVGTTPQERPRGEPPAELKAVVDANNAFALAMYSELSNSSGNLLLSPYSIFSALGLANTGAAGTTQQQIAQVLHYAGGQTEFDAGISSIRASLAQSGGQNQVELNDANGLWLQKGFSFTANYLRTARQDYAATLNEADFATGAETVRASINSWVERQTKQKIKNALEPGSISSVTCLVIVNAIYFKGRWANRFEESRTQPASFWISAERSIESPMMSQKQVFRLVEDESVQVLELPYVGQELSMLVVLPKQRDGLGDVQNQLNPELIAKWTRGLARFTVDVRLPRFKAQTHYSLKTNLMSLGMTDAFNERRADFSRMTTIRPVFISAVDHSALVEVNEEGTVAAAATFVALTHSSEPPPLAVFHADHPFLFLIRDNRTGTILFLGRITDPS